MQRFACCGIVKVITAERVKLTRFTTLTAVPRVSKTRRRRRCRTRRKYKSWIEIRKVEICRMQRIKIRADAIPLARFVAVRDSRARARDCSRHLAANFFISHIRCLIVRYLHTKTREHPSTVLLRETDCRPDYRCLTDYVRPAFARDRDITFPREIRRNTGATTCDLRYIKYRREIASSENVPCKERHSPSPRNPGFNVRLMTSRFRAFLEDEGRMKLEGLDETRNVHAYG